MPQLVKTGQSISTRLALMRPKLAITTVVLQSAGLLCLIFVAFQMQPWLMQGNIWESIQEENCVQDLILKTGSRDDPKDQSFKLEAQATVGSDGWYQVNRGEKQCSGSCYRALAQQTAQNCWLNQLFPSCEISSGHCPAFTLDKTTKRVAVQLGTKVTQLKGGESIDFTCSGAGYDGVIQFKGDAPRCRRTVPFAEPAFSCAFTSKIGKLLFEASSVYVTVIVGLVMFVASLLLNVSVFFLMTGANLTRLARYLYNRSFKKIGSESEDAALVENSQEMSDLTASASS